jgi:hypothetical protein
MEKRDLLLHYDEAEQKIIFYTVSAQEMLEVRAKEFAGAFTTIAELKKVEPQEAESKFGSMALSIIDHFSSIKTGIRDYTAISKAAHEKYVSEIEVGASSGNHEDEYHLFIEYHSRAMQEYLIEHLEKAEALLKSSAVGGYEPAIELLASNWALMKSAALRRIERAKKA